jgi:hypothetical protein
VNPSARGPSYGHEGADATDGQAGQTTELTANERETLERWARGRTVLQAQALAKGADRARLRGRAAQWRGRSRASTSIQTMGKWRARFLDRRVDGRSQMPHPNVHRKLSDERLDEGVRLTWQS